MQQSLCKKLTSILKFASTLFLIGFFSSVAQAFDTSTIPSTPSGPIDLQSGETYDFGWRNIYGNGVGDNHLFRCRNQSNITIRNVVIRNTNRFAIWIRGCHNVTLSNVTLRDTGWGGIRLERGTANSNITMSSINGKNLNGHGIELWDTDGFSLSNIRVDNTTNCGVLVNRSKNGTVGRVWGVGNDSDGGYATLRFANNAGPNISVSEVISRDSGRGYFTVSGSRDIRVNNVNIARSRVDGIYLQDGSDNRVEGGSSRGNPNCRIRNNPGSYIRANCGGSIAN